MMYLVRNLAVASLVLCMDVAAGRTLAQFTPAGRGTMRLPRCGLDGLQPCNGFGCYKIGENDNGVCDNEFPGDEEISPMDGCSEAAPVCCDSECIDPNEVIMRETACPSESDCAAESKDSATQSFDLSTGSTGVGSIGGGAASRPGDPTLLPKCGLDGLQPCDSFGCYRSTLNENGVCDDNVFGNEEIPPMDGCDAATPVCCDSECVHPYTAARRGDDECPAESDCSAGDEEEEEAFDFQDE